MKSQSLILFFVLCFSQLVGQKYDHLYSSGRLFQDPNTKMDISSPFLSFSFGGKQQWIAYDPNVTDGRFYSTSSSFIGAVSCGYVVGDFSLFDKQITADPNARTAIAVHVSSHGKAYWLYQHSAKNSEFLSITKLSNAQAIISGYEFTPNQSISIGSNKALLICIDRAKNIKWERQISDAIGLDLKQSSAGDLYWMVARKIGRKCKTEIQKIDPASGQDIHSIKETGLVKLEESPTNNMKFDLTSNGKIISARIIDDQSTIQVSHYSTSGNLNWQVSIAIETNGLVNLELKGIAQRPNGQYQVLGNFAGVFSIPKDQIEVKAFGDHDIFILTLDESGHYVGFEHYGSESTQANGFFKTEYGLGLVGSHVGALSFQDTTLVPKDNLNMAHGLSIYVDEYRLRETKRINLADSVISQLAKISVYPNPAKGKFVNVTFDQLETEVEYQIEVYGIDGRFVVDIEGASKNRFLKETLDIESLSSGLHFVFLRQNGKLIGKSKFIVE